MKIKGSSRFTEVPNLKILSIDSSSAAASASVVQDGKILSEVFVNNGFTHSKTLMNVVKSAVDLSGSRLEEIDLIACVTGPGSFTGVRIGVACAKGIAFTGDIPCIGISTLETFPYNISCIEGTVCGIMDARCNQVYTASFSVNNSHITRITPDRAVSIDTLIEDFGGYSGKIYLLGDGAKLVKDKTDGENIVLVNSGNLYQRASSAALAASDKNKDEYIAPGMLVPSYLRLPQAERELNNKKSKG